MTTLSNLEKEVLGFLYGRIGHRAGAAMPMRDLQGHFAEVSTANFWTVCADLIEKNLLINKTSDDVAFSPEGWQQAHDLQGKPAIRNPRLPSAVPTPPVSNEHLVWDLSRVADYEKACRFVLGFRKSLCVYSPPVQQLYSNYDILVPKDNERKLTILPNPLAAHDTFDHINADASVVTGVFIVPDAAGELSLMVPLKAGGWRSIPLADGLNMMQERMGPDEPFLPVLTKGDLREASPSRPMLHLHRLVLGKIKARSEMEIRSIRRTIQGNLTEHFGFRACS
jgi:hypothetical protein